MGIENLKQRIPQAIKENNKDLYLSLKRSYLHLGSENKQTELMQK